jgi:hypothetical protein
MAYAVLGRSMNGAPHEWVGPAVEYSLVLLGFVAAAAIGGTLLRFGILAHTAIERSCLSLWPRLAIAQAALFISAERLEGSRAGIVGVAVQIGAALAAAYLVSLFARVISACERLVDQVCRYCGRARRRVALIPRCRCTPHFSLAVCAGISRFQRPPPLRFI